MSGDSADEPAARYDLHDGVAVITLNRPAALKAVKADLSTDFGEGLEGPRAFAEKRERSWSGR